MADVVDPLTIALALGKFVPDILNLLVGPKAGAVAGKVVEIAQTVTGQATPDAALKAIQADPNLVLQFQKAVLDQRVQLEQLAEKNAEDVNATMRAEAGSEHWPTWSWRPAIGFAVAINVVGCTITVLTAYVVAMITGRTEHLAQVPGMLAAMAGLVAVVSPILGIASWFRGKMQADAAK